MITYEQYAEQFAEARGYKGYCQLFISGLFGSEIEEFTKGYAKLVAEAQSIQDENTPLQLDYTPIELI